MHAYSSNLEIAWSRGRLFGVPGISRASEKRTDQHHFPPSQNMGYGIGRRWMEYGKARLHGVVFPVPRTRVPRFPADVEVDVSPERRQQANWIKRLAPPVPLHGLVRPEP
jgi:hypothetical protein